MKKMYVIAVLSVLLMSCDTQTKQSEKTVEVKKFNLEAQLAKDGFAKIPLTKEISGHLHLKGAINGVNGLFILDTGAGATVIEQTRKEKFKIISEVSSDSATGAGGEGIEMEDSVNNKMSFATLTIDNQALSLMSLDYVNEAFVSLGMKEIDGVIGADILTNGKAIIDYANLILYLKK